MPFHLSKRRPSQPESTAESYIPTSPLSPSSSSRSGIPERSSSTDDSRPPSILRKIESPSNLPKRLSTLSFDRTDTVSSISDENSTRATSISSIDNQCPLPNNNGQKLPFFMMTLSSTSTLSFIALPLSLRPVVLDAITRAWRRGISKVGQVEYEAELMKKHKEKGCEGGVWEVTLKGDCWMPSSADNVSSKRILIYLMTEFAREGYYLTSSYRMSKKDSGKDTLSFLRGEPDPDPIFFAIAFHSSDKVWIIDSPADVGEALEEGIKSSWLGGIQAVRTRERHCREIRLRGNPWTSHSTSALISARCIHLVIMKYITHASRGYDFVGSVDMADLEEGELPVTFYRAKWGPTKAVWEADG